MNEVSSARRLAISLPDELGVSISPENVTVLRSTRNRFTIVYEKPGMKRGSGELPYFRSMTGDGHGHLGRDGQATIGPPSSA